MKRLFLVLSVSALCVSSLSAKPRRLVEYERRLVLEQIEKKKEVKREIYTLKVLHRENISIDETRKKIVKLWFELYREDISNYSLDEILKLKLK